MRCEMQHHVRESRLRDPLGRLGIEEIGMMQMHAVHHLGDFPQRTSDAGPLRRNCRSMP